MPGWSPSPSWSSPVKGWRTCPQATQEDTTETQVGTRSHWADREGTGCKCHTWFCPGWTACPSAFREGVMVRTDSRAGPTATNPTGTAPLSSWAPSQRGSYFRRVGPRPTTPHSPHDPLLSTAGIPAPTARCSSPSPPPPPSRGHRSGGGTLESELAQALPAEPWSLLPSQRPLHVLAGSTGS